MNLLVTMQPRCAPGGLRVQCACLSLADWCPTVTLRHSVRACVQAYVERELGACEVEHVACGSGLERIYAFLATDEPSNRPKIDLGVKLVRPPCWCQGRRLRSAKPLLLRVDIALQRKDLGGWSPSPPHCTAGMSRRLVASVCSGMII